MTGLFRMIGSLHPLESSEKRLPVSRFGIADSDVPASRASVRIASPNLPTDRPDANPYIRLLYGSQPEGTIDVVPCPGINLKWLVAHRRAIDVVHLHWPSFFYACNPVWRRWSRLGRLIAFIVLSRCLGVRVIWTMHNVLPHKLQPGRIDVVARRLFAASVNLVIAHDAAALDQARRTFGGVGRHEIIPHMSYEGAVPPAIPRSEARFRLNIDPRATMWLQFGTLRGNRNLEALVAAFRIVRLPGDILIIATKPLDDDVLAGLRGLVSGDDSIRLDARFIDDDLMRDYFCAADACVIAAPQTTSGVLFLSLTFGTPVIGPASMRPVDCGAAFLPHDGSLHSLAAGMGQIRTADAATISAGIKKFRQAHAPALISRRFLDALRGLGLGNPPTRPGD